MKTIIKSVSVLFFSVTLFVSCEKSIAPNNVIGDIFDRMYPHVSHIEWEMERGFYVAEFRENGYEKEVWFTKKNEWVLTKTEYERNVPTVVRQGLNGTDYANWRIDDVDYIEMPVRNPFYIAEVERGEVEVDLYLSHTGELIKEVADDGDYHRELL
ncbi:MAG: PepSY-like domain-containing protein [Prevotellaceae bacterium]|jgi:hypothetical protein|nr:PepSY-like domain-containing protein [Prevotellaceae bacterium]